MKQLLLFTALISVQAFAQIECNEVPMNYTGTCTSFYNEDRKSQERTYENGNVVAEIRYNRNGDTLYTYQVTGKGTLSFDRIVFSPGNKRSYAIHMAEGTGTYAFYHAAKGYLQCAGLFKDSVAIGDWIYFDSTGQERVRLTQKALNKEKLSSNLRLTVIAFDHFQYMQEADNYLKISRSEVPWVISDKNAANDKIHRVYDKNDFGSAQSQDNREINQPYPPEPVAPPPPVVKAEQVPPQEPVIEFPDKEAEFPGGMEGLLAYFNKNLVYPQSSRDEGIQGKVYVSFVIEKDGSTSNVTVAKGVCKELDQEAKRLIRAMPKWTPGEAGGKVVRTRFMLPIKFHLP